MVTEFSPHTERCLRDAGWNENFRIDVAPIVRLLEDDGFFVSPAATSFLEDFGSLHLSYPHFQDPTSVDSSHFDAVRAADAVFPARLKDWEAKAGEPLTPIGEAFREYMTLLMSPTGAVFAAMDDFVYRVAGSGREAIRALCEGKELGAPLD